MAAVRPKWGEHNGGPHLSYTPVEAMTGGQILERRTGVRKVGLAAAGTLVFAGVAFMDVKATRETPDALIVNEEHSQTAWRHCIIRVTFTAAASVGDKLKAAAAGAGVLPWEEGDDPRAIIGEAEETVSLGAVGLARVY